MAESVMKVREAFNIRNLRDAKIIYKIMKSQIKNVGPFTIAIDFEEVVGEDD